VPSLWLANEVVIEFSRGAGVSIVVPAARARIPLDGGEAVLLSEVARQNAGGRPCIFDDDARPGIARFVANFTEMRVLTDASDKRTDEPRLGNMLSLVENATLRMAQVGERRRAPLEDGEPCRKGSTECTGIRARIGLPDPDPPKVDLWDVVARRRSRRGAGERQISLQALSALLAFSLRVQSSFEGGRTTFRPVASGGARHPLDGFVVALRVSELPLGAYRYDPYTHALTASEVSVRDVHNLSDLALTAVCDRPNPRPALTLFFVAVPARTARYYRDIALSLIMRDLGCVTQQLYLLTEGLGLAGCAVGTVDPACLENTLHLSEEEVFVGAFSVW